MKKPFTSRIENFHGASYRLSLYRQAKRFVDWHTVPVVGDGQTERKGCRGGSIHGMDEGRQSLWLDARSHCDPRDGHILAGVRPVPASQSSMVGCNDDQRLAAQIP